MMGATSVKVGDDCLPAPVYGLAADWARHGRGAARTRKRAMFGRVSFIYQ